MIEELLSFLNEIGFSLIQVNIYKYILIHKFATIQDLQKGLKYSYAQAYQNLEFLRQQNLIECSIESKPKLYIRIEPKIALTELITKRNEQIKEKITTLEEELEVRESKYGRCLKDVNFYHYSDVNLAVNNYHKLFESAEHEIIMSSLPPSFLKKLEPSLFGAFMRGLDIKIYFSTTDFETNFNYFEKITQILKRVGVELIQTEQKTCLVVRNNDEIVNQGNILIDEVYLNSIVFKNDDVFHCDGFPGPYAKQVKGYLEVLKVLNRIKIEYPEPIQSVLSILEDQKSVKTRDLSVKAKLGGAKLKEVVQFLIDHDMIKEEIIKSQSAGRPKRIYSLVE